MSNISIFRKLINFQLVGMEKITIPIGNYESSMIRSGGILLKTSTI